MFRKTSKLTHQASGVAVHTPLLVPSFSSKGFALPNPGGTNEVGRIYEATSEFITETCLISAYDIFHGHLPRPADLPYTPELLFVDSGGYEVSGDYGYSAIARPAVPSRDWTLDDLQSVLAFWPEHVPAVFVNYDHPDIRQPFPGQVSDAIALFSTLPNHLSLFLLKPETKSQRLLDKAIAAATACPASLSSFDIVGVTEKELGSTMLKRMSQITRLRRAMDKTGVTAPIHVFGALDPVSVCLYYVSGAEIFDGLTWLRYAYSDGMAMYTHNVGAVHYGLHFSDDRVRSRAIAENCYELEALQNRLLDFASRGDYKKLHPHTALVKNAVDSLRARTGG